MSSIPLLRHTEAESVPREALVINPAKTCQPVGAMYAALGVHRCLPHSHGSQGCCSYHRSTLTRHYKEPVMAATSSFTEGASVFGGQSNLLSAFNTIFSLYDPEIIAVHTTCLSETIGDDIPQIIGKAKVEGKIPEGRFILHASTPSYIGSHVTGFASQVKAFVEYFAESNEMKDGPWSLFPGWVEPSDMSELKRIMGELSLPYVMLPDTSEVLNAPLSGNYDMFPEGGTKLEDIRKMGNSRGSFALGPFCSGPAAKLLDSKFKVPCHIMDMPIGLAATDRFIDTLRKVSGCTVSETVVKERGRLLDMIADCNQYTWGKKVALAGDPDLLAPLAEFLRDLDMSVQYVVSGTPGKAFESRLTELIGEASADQWWGCPGDMFSLHQKMKAAPVDLLIANTYGKYIAKDEDVPFIRLGFPILDRVGHADFPIVGYRGAMRILEKILAVLMDRQDRDAANESFELVM